MGTLDQRGAVPERSIANDDTVPMELDEAVVWQTWEHEPTSPFIRPPETVLKEGDIVKVLSVDGKRTICPAGELVELESVRVGDREHILARVFGAAGMHPLASLQLVRRAVR